MRRTAVIFFALLFLLLPSKLLSQEQDTNHLGIGISIDPSRIGHVTYFYFGEASIITQTLDNQAPILFYFPIYINDKIRIEPMFGLNTINSGNTQSSKSTISTDYSINTYTSNSSVTTIGLGGFYIASISNSFNMYLGPRIYFNFASSLVEYIYEQSSGGHYSRNDYKTETKESDITVGLALGAEYFPIRKFSFGAEASFNYTSYGNPDITNTQQQTAPYYTGSNDRTQYSYNTSGIFFVRWYFL